MPGNAWCPYYEREIADFMPALCSFFGSDVMIQCRANFATLFRGIIFWLQPFHGNYQARQLLPVLQARRKVFFCERTGNGILFLSSVAKQESQKP